MESDSGPKVALSGLGDVGLPLAIAFAEKFPTTGYDIKASRVAELRAGRDSTLEVPDEALQASALQAPAPLAASRA